MEVVRPRPRVRVRGWRVRRGRRSGRDIAGGEQEGGCWCGDIVGRRRFLLGKVGGRGKQF